MEFDRVSSNFINFHVFIDSYRFQRFQSIVNTFHAISLIPGGGAGPASMIKQLQNCCFEGFHFLSVYSNLVCWGTVLDVILESVADLGDTLSHLLGSWKIV